MSCSRNRNSNVHRLPRSYRSTVCIEEVNQSSNLKAQTFAACIRAGRGGLSSQRARHLRIIENCFSSGATLFRQGRAIPGSFGQPFKESMYPGRRKTEGSFRLPGWPGHRHIETCLTRKIRRLPDIMAPQRRRERVPTLLSPPADQRATDSSKNTRR